MYTRQDVQMKYINTAGSDETYQQWLESQYILTLNKLTAAGKDYFNQAEIIRKQEEFITKLQVMLGGIVSFIGLPVEYDVDLNTLLERAKGYALEELNFNVSENQ